MGNINQYLQGLATSKGAPSRSNTLAPKPNASPMQKRMKFFVEAGTDAEFRQHVMEARREIENQSDGSSYGTDGGGPPPQQIYGSVVRYTYPKAVLAEQYGTRVINFVQSLNPLYTPSNVVIAESICSDDVDGPLFTNVDNIGQFPTSTQALLGPFMAGGLAGYPHTGTTGLLAWTSHVTSTGALFLFVSPHIGITRTGDVGYIRRRGQNGRLSSTCGAVALAVDRVVGSLSAVPPVSADFGPDDYQQFTVTDILYTTAKDALTAASDQRGGTYGQRMVIATQAILNSSFTAVQASLSAAYNVLYPGGATGPDLYVGFGTFINVDDSYKAYVDATSFYSYTPSTSSLTDITTQFKAGFPF